MAEGNYKATTSSDRAATHSLTRGINIYGGFTGNEDLLSDVRDHALAFFRRGWMKLPEARPGTIRLLPQDDLRARLVADYGAMQGMILGEAPAFDKLIEQIGQFEERLNAL